MAKYIEQLDVSLNKDQEQQLITQNFQKIPGNLNDGKSGNPIYLWYKKGSVPVTKVQFSFNNDMAVGLIGVGYKKIPKNLNAGTGGDIIYLWYFSGSGEYDTPIVDMSVTTKESNEAAKFSTGWERLACDLTRGAGGNWIHLWLKREKQTYICDVTATDSNIPDANHFKEGYIRLDEDTNRGAGGAPVFTWYRQTTKTKDAITDLKVSTSDNEYKSLMQQHYQQVKVNLNEGTIGPPVYLWYKKDTVLKPIQDLTLLLNMEVVADYMTRGATVIERNLNTGNLGCIEYACYYQ